MKITLNALLLTIMMSMMTFMSYVLIMKIPLYIFSLAFILIALLFNNNIKLIYKQEEFEFYLYIILFIILILFQYIIFHKVALLFSMASFLSGLGIVFAVRYSLISPKGVLVVVEVFLIFQVLIGLIALVQAFTGQLYPSHFKIESHMFNGVWNRPSGVEGMTYNFAKNYIFPTIFTFIGLKYKLYKYSTFFTKRKLKFLLGYFIFIVIISKTRSTQLALFSLYIGYIIYTYKLYKLKYIIGTFVIFAIIFLFVVTHLDLFLDTSSKTRFILWYAGWNMFLSHPLSGVGMGLFGDYYREMNINLLWIGNDYDHRVDAPHNLFIGLLSETGIIGSFFIISAFYILLKNIRYYNYTDNRLKIINFSIYYYFIVYIIDWQFHNYWNDNYYWFWAGIALATLNIDRKMRSYEKKIY